MRLRFAACLTLAAVLALSACNRHRPEEQPETNNVVAEPENITNSAPPAPIENVVENKAEPAPPPKVTEDQQVQDDADATGLTARLPDGEDGSTPGQSANQTRPAN